MVCSCSMRLSTAFGGRIVLKINGIVCFIFFFVRGFYQLTISSECGVNVPALGLPLNIEYRKN